MVEGVYLMTNTSKRANLLLFSGFLVIGLIVTLFLIDHFLIDEYILFSPDNKLTIIGHLAAGNGLAALGVILFRKWF